VDKPGGRGNTARPIGDIASASRRRGNAPPVRGDGRGRSAAHRTRRGEPHHGAGSSTAAP